MMVITYAAFFVLGGLCIILQILSNKSRKDPEIGNNPIFLKFQRSYFLSCFPALFADWLQGPYLYRLYSHYGFQEDQIAVLYVCGFASTVLLGTWAPIAAEHFGRKKCCIFFTLIYSLACFFKLSRSYGILILGRILGGVATSLLFTSFESWYVHEHTETHDFPKEWLPVTFSKASVWNGSLAIIAGVVANMFSEWFGLGPVSPFMLAIPCLGISFVFITQWNENYGKQQVNFKSSCMAGLRIIVTEPKIFLIGIIQALFESVMYIFIFLWTPVLAPGEPSFGITFSSFMVCIMIGSALYNIFLSQRVKSLTMLVGAIAAALFANIVCIIAIDPFHKNLNAAFLAFLILEVAVGIYFPAMGDIRSKIIPDSNRTSIMNWFRVPLNLIACAVLMILHNNAYRHGNRLICGVCAALLGVAGLCALKFISMVKQDEEFQSDKEDSEQKPTVASA